MTPTEIESAARQRYNAENETFWSQEEILGLIWSACQELAIETLCIERTYSTSTVAGTQEYAMPSPAISVKRVTWNGRKLQPITFREDDTLTGYNQATTTTGDPQFYALWNDTIILRPIPDTVQTLKVYTINEAQEIDGTSVLEVPTFCHTRLVNYVVAEMAAKDENYKKSDYYRMLWEKDKAEIRKWVKRRLRSDAMAHVQDEATGARTILGLA